MIQIYEPIREKFTRKQRHKRIAREILEWAIAIGLGCSIIGRWIGARLIDIGCIIEQFFLPLLKRFWHMAMAISSNIHWG